MNAPDEVQQTKQLLGGLSLGEIPIAGSKRRSMAIACGGTLHQIGRISANKAFVIIRGNLRLLYVAPTYRNYRYAAEKVFGSIVGYDIDHVLARRLTGYHGFWYTLLTRVDRRKNRAHGWRERPPSVAHTSLNFDKFCYTDERILHKLIGRPDAILTDAADRVGYAIVRAHDRALSRAEAATLRHALGMNGPDVHLADLQPIGK